MTTTPTLETINAMSDDEVRAVNDVMAKRLVRKFAIRAAVATTIAVAGALVIHHIKKTDDTDETDD